MTGTPLLEVRDLKKYFPLSRKPFGERQEVRAVDGISFTLGRGETIGIVGESGCGKSTLARMLLGLLAPTGGRIILDGEDLTALDRKAIARRVAVKIAEPCGSLVWWLEWFFIHWRWESALLIRSRMAGTSGHCLFWLDVQQCYCNCGETVSV
jgi:ABC-type glutathione transport system ATPase component